MPSIPNLDISTDYAAASPSAQDRVPSSTLDSDHRAIELWSASLNTALGKVIRNDDTLVDAIVRLRNLHPEIQAVLGGLVFLEDVMAATTANDTLSGLAARDGYTPIAGNRMLVDAQTNQVQNGIYIAAAGAWTRSADANGTLASGTVVGVVNGASYAGTRFMLNVTATMGTTVNTWVPIDAQASLLSISRGGTGANSAETARAALGNVSAVVDTIAQLKALAAPASAVTYFVRGYYVVGDGGGGTFRWNSADSTTDNGGTIIQLAAGGTGRWNLIKSGAPVSLKQFGLKGDGTTNDTASFVLALAAEKNLFAPAGTYLLDSIVITLSGLSGRSIIGESTTTTIFKATGSVSNFLTVNGSYNQYNVFEKFTVDMTSMTDISASKGIYLTRAWGMSWNNVNVKGNGTNKISLYVDVGTYTSIFSNCDFNGSTGKVVLQGVSLGDAVTTIIFHGSSWANLTADMVVTMTIDACIVQGALNKFNFSNCVGVNVRGCDIEGAGTYLILGTGVSNFCSMANTFSNTAYKTGSIVNGFLLDQFGTTDFELSPTGNVKLNKLITMQYSSALLRNLFENTNSTPAASDIQFKNPNGSTYVGQTAAGDSVIDARGTGKIAFQQTGVDKLGVEAAGYLQIETTGAGAATAGAAGAPPAQVVGYIRVKRFGVYVKIPYYAD
jgi:hypothetical protein